MTPAERTIDRLKTLFVAVGMLGIVVIWVYLFQDTRRENAALASSPRYTIGQVTRTSYVLGPSPENVVFFSYRVGDSIYPGTNSGRFLDVGGRFLVKFSREQPKYHEFYNQVLIPVSIIEAPPEGWEKPPFPVPAEALE